MKTLRISAEQKEEAKRVRLAVGQAEYGTSLFPQWHFHVSASRRSLTVRAPKAHLSATWEWEPGGSGVATVEQAMVAVDLLVGHYLEKLHQEGVDLKPPSA